MKSKTEITMMTELENIYEKDDWLTMYVHRSDGDHTFDMAKPGDIKEAMKLLGDEFVSELAQAVNACMTYLVNKIVEEAGRDLADIWNRLDSQERSIKFNQGELMKMLSDLADLKHKPAEGIGPGEPLDLGGRPSVEGVIVKVISPCDPRGCTCKVDKPRKTRWWRRG